MAGQLVIGAVGLKYAPAAIGATVAASVALPFDMALATVTSAGLLVGIMFRAGLLVEKHRSTSDIIRDIGVSLLIGGANFVLAVNITLWLQLDSYLQALGVAAAVSASGVQSGALAIKWVFRKLVEQDAAGQQTESLGEKRQQDQRLLSAIRIAEKDRE